MKRTKVTLLGLLLLLGIFVKTTIAQYPPTDARALSSTRVPLLRLVGDEPIRNKVEHASTSPQRLPDRNNDAGGIKAYYFCDPDKHRLLTVM